MLNYAFQLREKGARNVLISCGGEGAFLVSETGQVFTSNTPKGMLINSVGAGDSMLAGFMAKFFETNDYRMSLKQGAASGSATAFFSRNCYKRVDRRINPTNRNNGNFKTMEDYLRNKC